MGQLDMCCKIPGRKLEGSGREQGAQALSLETAGLLHLPQGSLTHAWTDTQTSHARILAHTLSSKPRQSSPLSTATPRAALAATHFGVVIGDAHGQP